MIDVRQAARIYGRKRGALASSYIWVGPDYDDECGRQFLLVDFTFVINLSIGFINLTSASFQFITITNIRSSTKAFCASHAKLHSYIHSPQIYSHLYLINHHQLFKKKNPHIDYLGHLPREENKALSIMPKLLI